MTIHYVVDETIIKHFSTAMKLAIKNNTKIMVRNEERKNYKRETVLFRNGSLLIHSLNKHRKQWVGKRDIVIDDSVQFYSRKNFRSKYQRLKSKKLFVKTFNEFNYSRQQLKLKAEWHRLVYKIGYYDNKDLTINDVQKRMENIGCKFK